MTVSERAYAKINLSLDVVGRRSDGYHDLVSVMQSVSLCDELIFTRTQGEGIVLKAQAPVPMDESNLICRAARAYFRAADTCFGLTVELDKSIPMQAGMGGGSADAAATLRALNRLDGERFSVERLCEIGASIGADVPFCVRGGTCVCRGIGERLVPIENNLKCHVVVAMQGEGVSTPQAFAALDARYGDFAAASDGAAQRLSSLVGVLERGALERTGEVLYNRFEEVIAPVRPAVGHIKAELARHGAAVAQMSGSGPSVFGLFAKKEAAEQAVQALLEGGARAFLCSLV